MPQFQITEEQFVRAMKSAETVYQLSRQEEWSREEVLLVGYILIYSMDASTQSLEGLQAFIGKASGELQVYLQMAH